MAINNEQLREMVKDVLEFLDPEVPYSDAAVELVLLTIATESLGGTYVRQVRGPARGIVQIEPRTEQDLLNWIGNHPNQDLKNKMMQIMGNEIPGIPAMKYNLAYQIAMCRLYYRRVKAPLPRVDLVNWESPKREMLMRPDKDSINRLAAYWKVYYNTNLGKGVPEHAVKNYFKYGC